MKREIFTIDAYDILNWDVFHNEFAKKFDFPDYYGRNMDAWIDCMSDVCMGRDMLTINIENAKILEKQAPDILAALNNCCSFVNYRFIIEGHEPIICLSYSLA